jgi:hypothetical protein
MEGECVARRWRMEVRVLHFTGLLIEGGLGESCLPKSVPGLLESIC